MSSKKGIKIRVDPDFEAIVREIPRMRIKNGVEKKISVDRVSSRGVTKLMMRAPSWDKVIKECSTLVRREDLE